MIEQHVLRLEVAIDDVTRVKVIKSLKDTRRVEASRRIVKVASVPKNRPQLTAETRFQHHVEILCVLERFVEFDDEVAVCLFEDLLLAHDVLLLTSLDDLRLLHHFQGERLRRIVDRLNEFHLLPGQYDKERRGKKKK